MVVARPGAGGTSLQERVERSRAGRVLISLFLIVTLLGILTANLPPSRLQTLLLRADHGYLNGVDLSQDWGVFAPDPRQQTVDVLARVDFADGSHQMWHIPARNAVVGEYIDYRWRKWEEWVVSPAYGQLPRPAAIYIARSVATPEHRPVKVILIDRSHSILPPGGQALTTPPGDRQFASTRITPAMLGGAGG